LLIAVVMGTALPQVEPRAVQAALNRTERYQQPLGDPGASLAVQIQLDHIPMRRRQTLQRGVQIIQATPTARAG
jgi:hypothetical protein